MRCLRANKEKTTALIIGLVFFAVVNTGVYGLNFGGFSIPVWANTARPLKGVQAFLYKPTVLMKSKNNILRGLYEPKDLRAMLDVGDLFKGADPPSEDVLRAVESAGRRVTAADIASVVGISLVESQTALSSLAMLTSGTLEVSKDGDIVYNFDRNFRNILRAR
jgi:hypothetical protein